MEQWAPPGDRGKESLCFGMTGWSVTIHICLVGPPNLKPMAQKMALVGGEGGDVHKSSMEHLGDFRFYFRNAFNPTI